MHVWSKLTVAVYSSLYKFKIGTFSLGLIAVNNRTQDYNSVKVSLAGARRGGETYGLRLFETWLQIVSMNGRRVISPILLHLHLEITKSSTSPIFAN